MPYRYGIGARAAVVVEETGAPVLLVVRLKVVAPHCPLTWSLLTGMLTLSVSIAPR
jgi:hypothetical protein